MSEMELRILESEVVEHLGVDHTKLVKVQRLQVRYREGPRGESWWCEWEDVPVVSESAL